MIRALILCAAMMLTHSTAQAQDAEMGEKLFQLHCATCHGERALGDGPMAPAMMIKPANLRSLSEWNGGKFPLLRVVRRIDGREAIVSHGSPMPVYGWFFEGDDTAIKTEAGQPIMTSAPVVDLVAYLRSIQD